MRYLTRLALAAAASLLLIAALGAGTATAGTTLCKANETPCGLGNALTAESKLEFHTPEQEPLSIAFTTGAEACQAGFTAKMSNSGGKEENISGTLENWNFSCFCPTKVLKPGTFTLESTAGTMNGKFSISEIEVEINCGISGPRCLYTDSFSPAPVLKGGEPAVLAMEENTLPTTKAGVGICRLNSTWNGRWELTNYSSLWVSNG
jgi:hypothetical protein